MQTYEVAKANLAVGKAAVVQAQGTVSQAEATLQRALQNLDYCTIKSPVKGVIIDRRVNIGQTVVSSLNAPSLFLLAKDLNRLQVWVSVNEADIGRIKPGQPVTFTVDAQPGDVFPGKVGKIRLNATMTQNVVTYTVEVDTDNSGGKLFPYLTANVNFIVGERKNVLLVPNAALRWTPQLSQVVAEFRGSPKKAQGPEAPAQVKPAAKAGKEEQARGVVYVPQGTLVRPVYVDPRPERRQPDGSGEHRAQGRDPRGGGRNGKPAGRETCTWRQPLCPATLAEVRQYQISARLEQHPAWEGG